MKGTEEILSEVRKTWDTCDIQGFILLSLFLQTLLALFASFRKRTANTPVIILLWSAYSAADWTASYVVGLITNTIIRNPIRHEKADLLAFWAPFLLLHLGGQDTITAFALQDNELWIRYFMGFLFQVLSSAYIFYVSFPTNNLWFPTILVFLAGTVKFVERIRALYLASLDNFRDSMLTEPDPGPNYPKFMGIYDSNKEARLPVQLHMISKSNAKAAGATEAPSRPSSTLSDLENAPSGPSSTLSDLAALRHAYRFFETFKGLFVDLIFSFPERNQSRDFFLQRTAEDAFKVMEAELNFIYEILYTKVAALRCNFGYILRFISFVSIVVALVVFSSVVDKQGFHGVDVGITYALLLGAVALDTVAVIVLVSSDWSAASLNDFDDRSFATKVVKKMVIIRQRWFTCRRWSKSIPQYNFICYCLNQRSTMINKILGFGWFKKFLDEMKHVSREKFTDKLRDFIFQELKEKAEIAEDLETAKKMGSARGDWFLGKQTENNNNDNDNDYKKLLPSITKADYDKSLLLWHIATELCYNNSDEVNAAANEKDYRDFSKILSDYMLYLLVVRPTFTSAVAGICKVRFRDTLAEADEFFRELKRKRNAEQQARACKEMLDRKTTVKPIPVKGDRSKSVLFDACKEMFDLMTTVKPIAVKGDRSKSVLFDACKEMLDLKTTVKPIAVKGDRSKSVLFDACILAKELLKFKKNKWEIMSKVWVEMLSYAATRCGAYTHAQQLSKGGELLTFVWLLMAHFGLGERFQLKEGHVRAILIVGK